jgi:hypothetical protein
MRMIKKMMDLKKLETRTEAPALIGRGIKVI